MITQEHRAYLNAAAITNEVIDSCGIQSRTKSPTGIVFFWRDRDGVELAQLRPDEPAVDATGRPIKYVFPEGADLIMNRLRDADDGGPVLIVEGTKQQYAALSYAPDGFAVYGISGCWGWVDTKSDKVNWVPDLTWAFNREIFLLFDADLETNFQVWRAADEFAKQAKRSGVKSVKYVQTTARGKNGLDDVLGALPEDKRATFLRLWIEQAAGRLPKKPKRPAPSKYFNDNGALLVKKATEAVLERSPAALTAERDVALYTNGAYRLDKSAFIAQIVDLLGDDYRPTWRTTIEEVATGLLYSRGLILPDHPTTSLLNVQNGMLDLATMTLKPHDPSYMSVSQLPITWDAEAKAPTYEKWLLGVIPDQWEDLEEVTSTMLDPMRTPSKAIFCFGPTRSGKSTYIRIMQAVAGVENRSAVTLHQLCEDRFASANVYGRILNAASDLSATDVTDLSVFKMMTGEDAITGNRKYGKQFTFTNRALFAFSANELPTVGEVSRAYAERIKPFEFGKSFAGHEKPEIEASMMEELSGILVRWVRAWQRMNERGGYQPTLPRVKTAFEIGSSRILQWISDDMMIIAVDKTGAAVEQDKGNTIADLHRMFSKWAEINKSSIMGRKTFTGHLNSVIGVTEVRIGTKRVRGYNVVKRTEGEGEQDRGQFGQLLNTVEGFENPMSNGSRPNDVSPIGVNNGSETAQTARNNRTEGDKVTATDTQHAQEPPQAGSFETARTTHETGGLLVFDLETCAIEDLFRREDYLRLDGYLNGSGPVITTDHDDLLRAIAAADVVSGHNLTGFDLIALARYKGLDLRSLRGRVRDTDLEVRLDDPPESGKDGISLRPRGYYSLDASTKRYGVPSKTDELARLARIHGGYDRIPLDDPDYISYLTGDLYASAGLIAALPASTPYSIRENNVGLITAQMTVNGFRVDVPELTRTLAEQAERKIRNFAELAELTGMPLDKVTKYKTKPDKIEPYDNPLATRAGKEAIRAKLIKLGIDERHIPVTEKTRELSTNGEQMKTLRDKVVRHGGSGQLVRILDLVIELVAERTVYQTAETCRVDDRVHPKIRPYQASGRWSVTEPGLTVYGKRQGKHVERRIYLPEPRHRIVTFDLDQVDMRSVAAHSGDEAYLDIFRSGRDPHTEIAIAVFGDPKMREWAKPIGHGWNYGEGPNKIASQGVPIELAIQFDRQMRERYPRLVEWQRDVRSVAAEGDLLDNGFGRKMRAHPQYAYTQAPALVGQGCTRDILAEGLLRLPDEVWPMLRVIVHDELVLSIPEDIVEDVRRVVIDAMSFDLADVTGGRLASVPITAGSSKPGRTWAEVYEK